MDKVVEALNLLECTVAAKTFRNTILHHGVPQLRLTTKYKVFCSVFLVRTVLENT